MFPPLAGNTTSRHGRLRGAARWLLLSLVALSPWPFGCAPEIWTFALSLGILALLTLWVWHAFAAREVNVASDPVALGLLGLVLLTGTQLVPLPAAVVRVLSPTAWEWHRSLVPDAPELLPGEAETDAPPRAAWLRLSTDRAASEDLLAQLLAAFLIYTVARNFGASRESLTRLAWIGAGTGVALALLGITQRLAGPGRFPLGIDPGDSGFGTFANKNHFAFQVNLFAGLTGGLFVAVARRTGTWVSPAGLALLGGLGVMATAVAFSQSRGGLVAALIAAGVVGVIAWATRRGLQDRSRLPLVLGVGVALVVTILVAWLGSRGAGERIATLTRSGADNRTTDWVAAWPLVERFPLTGVGGGALGASEPLVRTRSDIGYQFNTLDNEYLEALVEGGLPRLALTLLLAVAAVGVCLRGYRQKPDSPNAPLLLGCGFGLIAVAVHSAVDFGLHIPSVALTVAVVAAFARATVDRRDESKARKPYRGAAAITLTGAVLLGGILVTLADWRAYRIERLRDSARTVACSRNSSRYETAVRFLEVAARVRPNDDRVWRALVAYHLSAADELQRLALASVGGAPVFAVASGVPGRPPAGDPGGHVSAALRAARQARAAQPLDPDAHLILGRFADRFARSEPPAAHFDRAKTVAGFDPLVWYVSGMAAVERGDWPTAWNDWRASLARSPVQLEAITREAARHLPPDELRTRVLPDDPALWFAATRFVCPEPGDDRIAWLRATAARWAPGPEPTTLSRFTAWAATLEELRDTDGAIRVWRTATERFPNELVIRDRLAALLEADERYTDAIPVLEWLAERQPGRGDIRHRLAATRHALKLLEDIGRP